MNIGRWLLERQLRKPFNGVMIRDCEARGDHNEVYMVRHYLYRSKMLSIYLHEFRRSDTDRALHDHPWNFLTIILEGGYWEHTELPTNRWPITRKKWYGPGTVLYRRASYRHYVELEREAWIDPETGHAAHYPRKAITLCIVGKKWRDWGFVLPEGWLNWRDAFKRWGCKP